MFFASNGRVATVRLLHRAVLGSKGQSVKSAGYFNVRIIGSVELAGNSNDLRARTFVLTNSSSKTRSDEFIRFLLRRGARFLESGTHHLGSSRARHYQISIHKLAPTA